MRRVASGMEVAEGPVSSTRSPSNPLGLSDGLTLRGQHPSAKPDSKGECLFAQFGSEGEFIVFNFQTLGRGLLESY